MVPPHVGDKVEKANHGPADNGRSEPQGAADQDETEVSKSNVEGLRGAENGRCRLKVALTQPALLLALLGVGTGRDVEEHVHLPASKLVSDELDEVDDGGILEDLGVHVEGSNGALGAVVGGGRDKDHVLLHVGGEAVVTVVLKGDRALAMQASRLLPRPKKTYRELPGEVGDTQAGVQSPANEVVEARVDGEGAVATLVGEDPDAGADETLSPAVDHPGGKSSVGVLNGRDVGHSEVDEGSSQRQVASDVAQRASGGGLEAVLGDSIANGLNIGELGDSLDGDGAGLLVLQNRKGVVSKRRFRQRSVARAPA